MEKSQKTVFKDQSALDLRFHLIQGNVDKNRLSVLKTKIISSGNVAIDASIIGYSHALSYTIDGVKLSEVFANLSLEEFDKKIQFGIAENRKNEISALIENKVLYSFGYQKYSWEKGYHLIEDMEKTAKNADDVSKIGLVYEFPKGELNNIPKTIVTASLDAETNSLAASSVHSYPGEGTIVITHTKAKAINPSLFN